MSLEQALFAAAKAFVAALETVEVPAAKKPGRPAKQPAKTEDAIVQEVADAAVETAEEVATVTKATVSKALEDLLKANKRNDAIAILKKFDATSVSTLPEKNYAAFCEAAETALLA